MTATEVRNSTWGNPSKLNKTTTKYGVHVQWVYSSGRYFTLMMALIHQYKNKLIKSYFYTNITSNLYCY